jgi:hypothetical protein
MERQSDTVHRLGLAEHHRRFIIITTGRTGSSLLSAILADAGADFAMDVPKRWDPSEGKMEHPDAIHACRWFRAADKISTVKPHAAIGRYRWTFFNSLGKLWLRSALSKAKFLKAVDGHLLVRAAVKLDFFPSVILSYRRFEECAISSSMMVSNTNLCTLVERYKRVNTNGLLLLNTFGGCAVSYEQLVDLNDRSWIYSLASLTNLPADKLIAARDRRVDKPSDTVVSTVFDGAARLVFETVEAIRGQEIAPSHQVLRSWRNTRGRSRGDGVILRFSFDDSVRTFFQKLVRVLIRSE